MRGVQVKLWDPLRMCVIPECLRGVACLRTWWTKNIASHFNPTWCATKYSMQFKRYINIKSLSQASLRFCYQLVSTASDNLPAWNPGLPWTSTRGGTRWLALRCRPVLASWAPRWSETWNGSPVLTGCREHQPRSRSAVLRSMVPTVTASSSSSSLSQKQHILWKMLLAANSFYYCAWCISGTRSDMCVLNSKTLRQYAEPISIQYWSAKAGTVYSVSGWTRGVQVKLRSAENVCHTWAP